jgi:hypothetical protein
MIDTSSPEGLGAKLPVSYSAAGAFGDDGANQWAK